MTRVGQEFNTNSQEYGHANTTKMIMMINFMMKVTSAGLMSSPHRDWAA